MVSGRRPIFLKMGYKQAGQVLPSHGQRFISTSYEILNLRIKDISFKTTGNKQYAEVLVNGKIGSRPIPLIQSIPYIKEWLSNHPSRSNPNSPLFVGLGTNSMGKQLTVDGLYVIYKYYKEKFFPKLAIWLKNTSITLEMSLLNHS